MEFLPYLLLIIGWNPAVPADTQAQSMALRHSLHATQEDCETRGKALVDERNAVQSEAFPVHYAHFCIPAPTAEELDGLFLELTR